MAVEEMTLQGNKRFLDVLDNTGFYFKIYYTTGTTNLTSQKSCFFGSTSVGSTTVQIDLSSNVVVEDLGADTTITKIELYWGGSDILIHDHLPTSNNYSENGGDFTISSYEMVI
jgi:hypothetical protein